MHLTPSILNLLHAVMYHNISLFNNLVAFFEPKGPKVLLGHEAI